MHIAPYASQHDCNLPAAGEPFDMSDQETIRETCLVMTIVMRDGFPAGSTGVVVSLYRSGPACEVEVWDEIGYPADIVTYLLSEVSPADCHNAKQCPGRAQASSGKEANEHKF